MLCSEVEIPFILIVIVSHPLEMECLYYLIGYTIDGSQELNLMLIIHLSHERFICKSIPQLVVRVVSSIRVSDHV